MDYFGFVAGFVIFLFGFWVITLHWEIRGNKSIIIMLRKFQEADQKYIKNLESIIDKYNLRS